VDRRAYNLVFAALVLASGNLSDRLGRKGVLLAGLAVFGAGAVAGGLGANPAELIAARAVMGLGAALIFPPRCRCSPTSSPSEGSAPARSGCGARRDDNHKRLVLPAIRPTLQPCQPRSMSWTRRTRSGSTDRTH
jgi:Major Facilitator Superfamily